MTPLPQRITLKFISSLLISLILIMTAIQIISMLSIKKDVSQIQQLWDEVQVEQSEKLRLEKSIRFFLGYGGMIHKLKDSVLNNNNNLEAIKSDLYSAKAIIKLYLSFKLSKAERYALNDILMVVEKYEHKLHLLPAFFKKNPTIKELDNFLRINDIPALHGLAVIEQHNRHHSNNNQRKQPNKFVLLTDIAGQIGYGGLIHHIKNVQLRFEKKYLTESQNSIDQLNSSIKKYKQMPLVNAELRALDNLQQTVTLYQTLLNKLATNKTVKIAINDQQTIQALKILNQRIETELKNKIANIGKTVYLIQSNINKLIQTIILLSIATLLFFSYIMFKKVIIPLQKITQTMVLLARNHHKQKIIFNPSQIYEIQQIIRSLHIFKNHKSKQRISEKQLQKVNATTLKQLDEIKILQSKSEEKTEQALNLANHLIELQKSAETDRKNALESQRRTKTILNTVHDAIITTNKKGIIENINTATVKMFGYSKGELINKNINLILSPEISSKQDQILQDYHNQEGSVLPKDGRELLIKHADGSTFPVEVFLGKSEFNKEIKFTAVIRDITQRKKNEQAIQHLVMSDPLTDLANRRHFNSELQRALDSKERLQLSVALLMIDLDNFKPVNDTYGHNMGDKVLQKVASRLQKVTRKVDLIARLGGDEFAIIINAVSNHFDAITPAKKVIETLSKPMLIKGETIQIGASVGISISPKDALTLKDFINNADKALYKAKELGRGTCFSYKDLNIKKK